MSYIAFVDAGYLRAEGSRLLGLRTTAVRVDAAALVFKPDLRQKGVDTLLALDLVRLAGRRNFGTAVLLAGDRDLGEAVRTAQDFGQRVVVATPSRRGLSRELAQLADDVILLDEAVVRAVLPVRVASVA